MALSLPFSKQNDVNWMYMTMKTILKVIKCMSGYFEYTVSISKQPAGSVHIGKIIYYFICLPIPFLRGLEVDLEGSSTFPILMLNAHC